MSNATDGYVAMEAAIAQTVEAVPARVWADDDQAEEARWILQEMFKAQAVVMLAALRPPAHRMGMKGVKRAQKVHQDMALELEALCKAPDFSSAAEDLRRFFGIPEGEKVELIYHIDSHAFAGCTPAAPSVGAMTDAVERMTSWLTDHEGDDLFIHVSLSASDSHWRRNNERVPSLPVDAMWVLVDLTNRAWKHACETWGK